MDARDKRESEAAVSEVTEKEREGAAARKRTGEFLKNVFFGSMYALWGYLLGGAVLPYGAMPLGVAFLAAADRRVFYIYGGLLLSIFTQSITGERRLLLAGVYTAVLFVRLLTRLLIDPPWKAEEASGEKTVREVYPQMFSEHIALRAALSAVGAFAIGVYRLIEGGMLYYDMYGTIVATLSAPVAVLLCSGFFSASAKKYRRLIGFLAIAFGVIYSAGDLKLYGVSLAAFGCMFATLYLARTEGTVTGVLSGALLGLAISIEQAPLFAFAGLVAGMLYPISAVFALCSALSVAVAWGIYVEGLSVLNGLLSALVSAALIFGVWDKLFLGARKKKASAVTGAAEDEAEKENGARLKEDYLRSRIARLSEAERYAESERRLRGLSEGLSSISEMLYGMSRALTSPCYADLKQICDNAFEVSCAGCENRSVCWKESYRQTNEALGGICGALQKKGSVETEDAERELADRCLRLPDILSQINHNAYLHSRQLAENDRTELFAADFEAIASLMEGAAMSEDGSAFDAILSAELARRLSEKGIPFEGVCALGKERKRAVIFSEDTDTLIARSDTLAEIAKEVFGLPSGPPEQDREAGTVTLRALPKISVSYAKKSLRAEGEDEFCGDTSGIFEGEVGRSYAFISDGMGSGREAALTSGLCGLFLRRLIASGCGAEGALKLLNGFLRNRCGTSLCECSATVDLMELDAYLCRASFYKSGAAPTYVYRNGSLFKLRSHTVPVGIIKELDFRKIDLELSCGDLVVMVSDGVTDGKEECPWLFDLLRSQSASEPERIAELIVKYAKSEGATDDISVIVAKV